MKVIRVSAIAYLAFSAIYLQPALSNHRTGLLALPELIVAGDFNADGNLDLAVNVTGFDNVAIFLGDGKGGFILNGHIALDTLPKGLAAGDVDGDGHADLVSSTAWGYTLRILRGDGVGGFSSAQDIKGDGEPTRLALADFNKDGHLDIAVNAPDEGRILIYFGAGKKGFLVPAEELEGYPRPFGAAVGDFNSDGNPDIVFTTRTGNKATASRVAVVLGDDQGGFQESTLFSVNQMPASVKVGDLNGDGIQDFVLAGAEANNTEGNFISTYLGDGTGHFTLKQTIALDPGNLKGDIALGDFNEDGNLDVAFPVTGIKSDQRIKSKTVLIFFGDGTGKLVAGSSLTVGREPHTVFTADFNKDGHLDLAVSNRTDGTISILLGDGKGNFTPSSTLSVLKAGP
jgi:hypothetical protein